MPHYDLRRKRGGNKGSRSSIKLGGRRRRTPPLNEGKKEKGHLLRSEGRERVSQNVLKGGDIVLTPNITMEGWRRLRGFFSKEGGGKKWLAPGFTQKKERKKGTIQTRSEASHRTGQEKNQHAR